MQLDAYIRVSRVAGRAGESFISPAVQRERIDAYAKAYGHKVALVHEDLDQPGSSYARPGFQAALKRVEAGEVGGIIVAALDRFARSVPDAATALRRLEDAGGVLISVRDALDTSTPVGRFARTMMLAIAELELERIREAWATAQAHAVARGVHIASRTPTGYRRREDGRLEPDPTAAPAIRELFRRRAAGAGWTELATYLDSAGVVGPYGNAAWTPSAVSKIVRNRVYLGEARSGSQVNADAHEAIVTRAEFEAAGLSRGTTRPGTGSLLGGILRCAGCRYVMKADKMTDRDGSRLVLYRCRRRHASGVCKAPASVLARLAEPYVEQLFLGALEPDGALAYATVTSAEAEEALRAVEDAELDLETYRDEPGILAAIGRASYVAGLETRARAVDEARQRLAATRERSHLAESLPTTPGDLATAWPSLKVAERRTILDAAVGAAFVRAVRGSGRQVPIEERLIVLWRGDEPAELPRRGRRVALEPYVWPSDREDVAGVTST